ncbi:hypothetical protein HanRHA438_Chr05g0239051 [Helianthus annuus]|nr:hypothetical protein HanRHA438_Chr05g0239051 [Helianthus annuus]
MTTPHETRNPVRVSIIVVVKPIIPVPLVIVSWLAVIFITVIPSIPVTTIVLPNVIGILIAKLFIFVPSRPVVITPVDVSPIFIIVHSIIVVTPVVRIFSMHAYMFRRTVTGNTIRFIIGDCISQVVDIEKWIFIRGIDAITITSTIGIDIPIIKVDG